jgi:hypothetical protein
MVAPKFVSKKNSLVPLFEDSHIQQSGHLDRDHMVVALLHKASAIRKQHCVVFKRLLKVRLVDVAFCAVIQDHRNAYISEGLPCS